MSGEINKKRAILKVQIPIWIMFLFYVLSFFKKGTLFKGGHYLRKYGICKTYNCSINRSKRKMYLQNLPSSALMYFANKSIGLARPSTIRMFDLRWACFKWNWSSSCCHLENLSFSLCLSSNSNRACLSSLKKIEFFISFQLWKNKDWTRNPTQKFWSGLTYIMIRSTGCLTDYYPLLISIPDFSDDPIKV